MCNGHQHLYPSHFDSFFSHQVCICVLLYNVVVVFFFFFQAEDGIRDIGVTGVQTCALPILHLSALHFLGLPPISGLPIDLGPLQLPWVTQPQHNRAQRPPWTSVESSPNHPAPIWAIYFTVGWLNPLSHPRTLSGQVTIAKVAPLLTAVSPVAGSHTSLSHGPWVGKFFFLGKTLTCCP